MVLLKLICFPLIFYTLYNTCDYWYWMISWMTQLITLTTLAWVLSRAFVRKVLCKHVLNRTDPSNKIILVTGCSSGFGFASAVELNRLGYYVLAGDLEINDSRSNKLLTSVKNPHRFKMIKLDVTNPGDIRSAHETVKELIEKREDGVTQLYALINNAGYSSAHLNEAGDPYDNEIYQKHLDVNYLAPIRLTRVMLPLIRASKGRVIMMGSQATRTSSNFISPYAASKSALAKFTECLGLEVAPFNVKVIGIEPAFFQTGMTNVAKLIKDMEESFASSSDEVKQAYKETCKMDQFIRQSATTFSSEHVIIPDISMVIRAVVDSIELYEPDIVNSVCSPLFDLMTRISEPFAWELKATCMDLAPKIVGFIIDYKNNSTKVSRDDNDNYKKK